jgi:acetylornithine deacetylase/succinyl-diaminopimelate desuccinylase-like protein
MRPEPRGIEPALRILEELVRIRSDSGSVMGPVVERAAGFLEGMGLSVNRYAFSTEAPCIAARYRARADADIGHGCLVLHCHLDTAGFDAEKWRVDPLSAKQIGGRIFGRGTIDCKGLAAVWISLLGEYAVGKVEFPFDLVFVAVSDEESEGSAGVAALLAETREFDEAFLVMGEGGGYPLRSGKRTYYTVQTGEMEKWVFKNGRQSKPRKIRPCALIDGLRRRAYTKETVEYRLRARIGLSDPGRRLSPEPMQQEFADGTSWYRADLGVRPRGFRSACAAALEVETGIPGASRIGLKAVRRALRRADGTARILPMVTVGHGDNRYFRIRGIPTLGFFPLAPGNSVAGCHGENEYLSTESLRFAKEVLGSTIQGLKEAFGG